MGRIASAAQIETSVKGEGNQIGCHPLQEQKTPRGDKKVSRRPLVALYCDWTINMEGLNCGRANLNVAIALSWDKSRPFICWLIGGCQTLHLISMMWTSSWHCSDSSSWVGFERVIPSLARMVKKAAGADIHIHGCGIVLCPGDTCDIMYDRLNAVTQWWLRKCYGVSHFVNVTCPRFDIRHLSKHE